VTEELCPVELVTELQWRHVEATGEESPLIHASRGFKRLVDRWSAGQFMVSDPEYAKNQMLGSNDIHLNGFTIRIDIPSKDVLLVILPVRPKHYSTYANPFDPITGLPVDDPEAAP
jgi:hypothetical protein